MILHTFNSIEAWQQYADLLTPEDVALFLEDGVLATCRQDMTLHDRSVALATDLAARGLTERCRVQALTDSDFVELCVEASKVVSWHR